ncbi:MAG: hypothetical protein LUB59_06210 [Candidatus Gastranaerophilales bacterium]|nr:hypothetical protein [Candidatus Gastranaerophilales bacterium]
MDFFLRLIKDPPVLIIISVFIGGFTYTLKRYLFIAKNLKQLYVDLESFTKNNLSYRYEEFKQILSNNICTAKPFEDFKDALVFSDTIAFQDTEDKIEYENVSESISGIQTTTDIPYFFNEESMVFPHYNKNLVGVMPTLLTGFGPLFTFIKIATAFGLLDFTSAETITHTVAEFVSDMQIAAMCSVLAVGSCLVFTIIDKMSSSLLLMPACGKVQQKLASLFNVISTEAFLIDLLKTSKIQNHENGAILKAIPKSFASSIQKDLANVIMPYLDSLIFGVNTLNDTMAKKSESGDELGGLF